MKIENLFSVNTIFFGTPDFAVLILKKLIKSGMSPVAIVTSPDKPVGRGQKLKSPPVKTVATEYHIPVLQPAKLNPDFLFQVSSFKPDVFVIAAYGKILPASLLNIPPQGTINVHPSLLPRHRGPSPIQQTILDGDELAGVTLMLTDEKMDHGPILAQQELFPSISKPTYPQLHDVLARLGGELLIEILPKWIAGNIIPKEQDHAKATYTKLLTKEDGHVDWSKPAAHIERMVRALNPWPGTWSYLKSEAKPPIVKTIGGFASDSLIDKKRLKILTGHVTNEPSFAPPGTLTKTKSGLLAVCTGDTLYVIEKLQVEGKKEIHGQTLLHSIVGSIFT